MPDGSKYVQTVPDGKYLCPDRPRRKLPMSRLSCVRQTFVRSPDFCAFMSRLSCVHVQTFARSGLDFRAFTRLSCVQPIFVRSCPDFGAFTRFSCVQPIFVRSCPDFRAFTRLSCVQPIFVRSCPDFGAFTRFSCVQPIFVRSCPDFRAFTRLSCVQPIIVRSCPDFGAFTRFSCFHVQTFVRFLMFPDYVILNARRPPRAFIFGLDILAFVWDLNLGYFPKNKTHKNRLK